MSTCSAPDAWLFRYQLREGLGGDAGPAGSTDQGGRGRKYRSLESDMETGEAGSFRSSSSPLLALPILSPAYPVKMPTRSQSRYTSRGLLASLEQAGQERPLDSCSSWAIRLAGGAHLEGGSSLSYRDEGGAGGHW